MTLLGSVPLAALAGGAVFLAGLAAAERNALLPVRFALALLLAFSIARPAARRSAPIEPGPRFFALDRAGAAGPLPPGVERVEAGDLRRSVSRVLIRSGARPSAVFVRDVAGRSRGELSALLRLEEMGAKVFGSRKTEERRPPRPEASVSGLEVTPERPKAGRLALAHAELRYVPAGGDLELPFTTPGPRLRARWFLDGLLMSDSELHPGRTGRREPYRARVELPFTAPGPGLHRVRVEVKGGMMSTREAPDASAGSGAFFKVDPDGVRVLIAAGTGRAPSRLLGALSQESLGDGFRTALRRRGTAPAPGPLLPPGGPELDSFDLVVLAGCSPADLRPGELERLIWFVRAGGGLLLAAEGDEGFLDSWRGSAFAEFLPSHDERLPGGTSALPVRKEGAGRVGVLLVPSVVESGAGRRRGAPKDEAALRGLVRDAARELARRLDRPPLRIWIEARHHKPREGSASGGLPLDVFVTDPAAEVSLEVSGGGEGVLLDETGLVRRAEVRLPPLQGGAVKVYAGPVKVYGVVRSGAAVARSAPLWHAGSSASSPPPAEAGAETFAAFIRMATEAPPEKQYRVETVELVPGWVLAVLFGCLLGADTYLRRVLRVE